MKIVNKRAKRDYEILEKYEAGIALQGWEVKSIKEGRAKLEEAFVKLKDDGAYLINSFVAPYKFSDQSECEERRPRKLLLKKKELVRLKTKLSSTPSLTIIPLSFYLKGNLIKLEIALAKGRKKYEKKNVQKQKEIKRIIEREIKEYLKS